MTMHLIQKQTISSSGITAVNFTSIPQTFLNLQLRVTERSNNAAVYDALYVYNLDGTGGSSNMAFNTVFGTGTAAGANGYTGSFSGQFGFTPANNSKASVFGSAIIDIHNYTDTNKLKPIKSIWGWYDNDVSIGAPYLGMVSGVSMALGTNPVTALSILVNNSFGIGSTFALYGTTSNPVATGA
jgi:hypothetical protein